MNSTVVRKMVGSAVGIVALAASTHALTLGELPQGFYRIEPKCAPGKVIDVPGCGTSQGSKLQLWDIGNCGNQIFFVKDVGSSQFTFCNDGNPNQVWDIEGGSTADGARLQLWGSNGTNAQKFWLDPSHDNGGTWITIKNVNSGRTLDIANCSNSNGAIVHQWGTGPNDCRKFYFRDMSVARVYKDCSFNSRSWGLRPGDYNLSRMQALGIGNDDISAIRVNTGYKVELFEHDNFGGARVDFYGDDECLVDNGINDWASSMKVIQLSGWRTDFRDNFDSPSGSYNLNHANWSYDTWAAYNNEEQCYTSNQGTGYNNNIDVSNGTLKIRLLRQDNWCPAWGKWVPFTSGRLITKNKHEFNGGKWEFRCHVFYYNCTGLWPAVWLLGKNINETPTWHSSETACWPLPGAREVDMFEWWQSLGNNTIGSNTIRDAGGCQAPIHHSHNWSAADVRDWHTYTCDFHDSQGYVRVYQNGVEKYRNTNYGAPTWYWHGGSDRAMYVIMNLAVGGVLGGAWSWGSGAYAGFEVDWIQHMQYHP